ncbi:ABC transporter permease [Blastomonas sp.]|uniref:ABC transporter permease n=1 Tax=Blastomonas sp. TaxID=1909299 RepID=UPI0035942294
MNAIRLIAADEWRLMRRNRVAMLGLAILSALSLIAALTSIAQRDNSDDIRARFQTQADKAFDGAPARHPHRMVHYGHFVFRPLPALAAFDPGVDAFTGNTIYLEGHRQNSANFGDVRQSSLLVRFGQLTPAFVLQALAPLMLIFIGFGIVARERERGTIRQLFAHGVTARRLLIGKTLGLGGIAALMLAPGALALGWLVVAEGAPLLPSLALLGGYTAYLAVWVLLIIIASSLAAHARTALMALIGIWAFTVILLPRIAPDVALASNPALTRLETDIAIAEDLRRMGDSHNPDDPFFSAFKARTLKQYGVEKVEDLPVNYGGLLAVEGEALTSKLFDDYANRQFAAQKAQSGLKDTIGLFSPTIALRRVSMSASGTDLEGHRRFLAQAEAYRFAIVQQLNQLQATKVTYADDRNRNKDPEAAKRVRIDAENWKAIPDFRYKASSISDQMRTALPGLVILFGWLLALGFGIRLATRRLGEAA